MYLGQIIEAPALLDAKASLDYLLSYVNLFFPFKG